ncbi:histidyl-tRNA synthetase [Rhizobiales bacterium GAS191]|jgi:histidyl-tRNA synthetase|nr:histidyl-tRNA synthetase [Rhizobiales bacterium GAS113]SED00326.1 histidyl-tRNA synthetase [Rhizobiales bacterium GAS191]
MSTDPSAKANRLKARLPRGLADRGPAEIAATERMLGAIRAVYERYGFEPMETPFIEYTDALGKFLPDQDRPNEGVFSFKDDDEQWLSLRYDLTAPLARHVAEHFDALPKPFRSYRAGFVFRNEKPGPGRFRQFMQFDADTVGAPSPAADAEMCMMMADVMEAVGVKRGDYVIRVNNRKVLDGVMDGAQIPLEKRLSVLRGIDKLDRLGIEGVRLLLGPEGRKDESGDVTKGAGLSDAQVNAVIALIRAKESTNEVTLAKLFLLSDAAGELSQIASLASAAGYAEDRIRIDPSVVRGLEYYTGPVFEAELTFQVPNEKGQPVVFGSVGGGGRYDGLVGRFRGEDVPATGFSIGVSRLFSALKAVKSPIVTGAEEHGPVVVLVMDRERVADYQHMASSLRAAGIKAEMYLGAAGMKAQMKYADKRGAPLVVIQGGDEKARGEVQIKDLVEGARQAKAIASHEDYKAARPAQLAVPEAELIMAVQEALARQKTG